jgi:hypothetical protein
MSEGFNFRATEYNIHIYFWDTLYNNSYINKMVAIELTFLESFFSKF